MKTHLTLLTCLFFLLPNFILGETIDELVKRDGLFYKKNSEIPFSGEVTGQYQGSYKNGKAEGPWIFYYPNGQLFSKGNYKNALQDGPWITYNIDGTVNSEETGTYKNGKKVSN